MALEMTTTAPDYLGRTRTHLDWMKLEPGDVVFHITGKSSYYGAVDKRLTVERLTATLIVMADGSRWRRDDGTEFGGTRFDDVLMHPQDDSVINVQQQVEFRMFKRALEDIAKRKATTFQQMMSDADEVDKVRSSFQARITILEGKRRVAV